MTQHDDRVYLEQMRSAAEEAQSYLNDIDILAFSADQMRQRAVIYVVQIIGEASKRVSKQHRILLHEIPWSEIAGMRNRLVHDYMGVDIEEVWRAVKQDIPTLIELLERGIAILTAEQSPAEN